MTRAVRPIAVAVMLVAMVAAMPGAAVGHETPPRQTELGEGVRLASQTPWVAPEGEFQLRVRVSDRLVRRGNELAVVVYQRVRTRSAFALTLEDRVSTSPIDVSGDDITKLTPDAGDAYVIRIPVSSGTAPVEPGAAPRLVLRREGVYPVRVEVREEGGGRVLAGLTTHLVRVPTASDLQPLSVAWVQAVSAPPAHKPDGTISLTRHHRERLEAIIDALGSRDIPLTVVPRPETLAALSEGGGVGEDMLATLRDALRGRQVLSGPYAEISLPTLLALGLEDEALAHLVLGDETLESVLDVRADTRTALASQHLDTRTVSTLRRIGVDRLVVPEDALEPLDLSVTLTNPFRVEGTAARLHEAAAIDRGMAAHFPTTSGADPVLGAHQLLADLAVVYLDRPGLERGIVVTPPDEWEASSSFLATAFQGLLSAPMLEPVTLDQFFDRVPVAEDRRDDPLVRDLADTELPRLGVNPAAVRATRARLAGFASMVDTADSPVPAIEATLLLATGSAPTAGERRSYLTAAEEAIDDEIGAIQAASQGITLTARKGTIPLTFQNLAGYPVTVAVDLDSDKLVFPEASLRKLRELQLDQRNTTVEVDVRARTSGAFPLRVTVTSPDGRLLVNATRLTVRSRAVSGVGLLLMGGAGLFLLVWWANHIRTGRRDRRLVDAVT